MAQRTGVVYTMFSRHGIWSGEAIRPPMVRKDLNMNRQNMRWIGTAFLTLALAGAARAADPIGEVIAQQGAATATAADKTSRDLAVKGPVFARDTVLTGPGARIQIRFTDESTYAQGEKSEMVLDEYVFDPGAKENNTFSAKITRGTFRAVTGKITEMNPSRFRIQTGHATIGIRGCGIAGEVGGAEERFAVDFVEPNTGITITPRAGGGHALEFMGPGIGFVDVNGQTRQGPFDAAFFNAIVTGATPKGGARGGPQPGAGGTHDGKQGRAVQGRAVVPDAPRLMNHGELAELLVRKLGLFRLMPANATPLDAMMILSQQGIFPSPSLKPTEQNQTPGWKLDAKSEVSLADLAVVIVRALGLEGKVQGDKNDPQNWLDVLKEIQVPVDSIGAAVGTTQPLGRLLVNLPIFAVTEDPIVKRFIPLDTTTGVINSLTLPNVGGQLPTGETGPPPKPATPN